MDGLTFLHIATLCTVLLASRSKSMESSTEPSPSSKAKEVLNVLASDRPFMEEIRSLYNTNKSEEETVSATLQLLLGCPKISQNLGKILRGKDRLRTFKILSEALRLALKENITGDEEALKSTSATFIPVDNTTPAGEELKSASSALVTGSVSSEDKQLKFTSSTLAEDHVTEGAEELVSDSLLTREVTSDVSKGLASTSKHLLTEDITTDSGSERIFTYSTHLTGSDTTCTSEQLEPTSDENISTLLGESTVEASEELKSSSSTPLAENDVIGGEKEVTANFSSLLTNDTATETGKEFMLTGDAVTDNKELEPTSATLLIEYGKVLPVTSSPLLAERVIEDREGGESTSTTVLAKNNATDGGTEARTTSGSLLTEEFSVVSSKEVASTSKYLVPENITSEGGKEFMLIGDTPTDSKELEPTSATLLTEYTTPYDGKVLPLTSSSILSERVIEDGKGWEPTSTTLLVEDGITDGSVSGTLLIRDVTDTSKKLASVSKSLLPENVNTESDKEFVFTGEAATDKKELEPTSATLLIEDTTPYNGKVLPLASSSILGERVIEDDKGWEPTPTTLLVEDGITDGSQEAASVSGTLLIRDVVTDASKELASVSKSLLPENVTMESDKEFVFTGEAATDSKELEPTSAALLTEYTTPYDGKVLPLSSISMVAERVIEGGESQSTTLLPENTATDGGTEATTNSGPLLTGDSSVVTNKELTSTFKYLLAENVTTESGKDLMLTGDTATESKELERTSATVLTEYTTPYDGKALPLTSISILSERVNEDEGRESTSTSLVAENDITDDGKEVASISGTLLTGDVTDASKELASVSKSLLAGDVTTEAGKELVFTRYNITDSGKEPESSSPTLLTEITIPFDSEVLPLNSNSMLGENVIDSGKELESTSETQLTGSIRISDGNVVPQTISSLLVESVADDDKVLKSTSSSLLFENVTDGGKEVAPNAGFLLAEDIATDASKELTSSSKTLLPADITTEAAKEFRLTDNTSFTGNNATDRNNELESTSATLAAENTTFYDGEVLPLTSSKTVLVERVMGDGEELESTSDTQIIGSTAIDDGDVLLPTSSSLLDEDTTIDEELKPPSSTPVTSINITESGKEQPKTSEYLFTGDNATIAGEQLAPTFESLLTTEAGKKLESTYSTLSIGDVTGTDNELVSTSKLLLTGDTTDEIGTSLTEGNTIGDGKVLPPIFSILLGDRNDTDEANKLIPTSSSLFSKTAITEGGQQVVSTPESFFTVNISTIADEELRLAHSTLLMRDNADVTGRELASTVAPLLTEAIISERKELESASVTLLNGSSTIGDDKVLSPTSSSLLVENKIMDGEKEPVSSSELPLIENITSNADRGFKLTHTTLLMDSNTTDTGKELTSASQSLLKEDISTEAGKDLTCSTLLKDYDITDRSIELESTSGPLLTKTDKDETKELESISGTLLTTTSDIHDSKMLPSTSSSLLGESNITSGDKDLQSDVGTSSDTVHLQSTPGVLLMQSNTTNTDITGAVEAQTDIVMKILALENSTTIHPTTQPQFSSKLNLTEENIGGLWERKSPEESDLLEELIKIVRATWTWGKKAVKGLVKYTVNVLNE